ncbi:hypothetical protein Anapl_10960 [Anas platyrhynchos]|uniref:Uncharacterized protein n=1 Tax=Anas platyrhynchos TaxID=8839 RepID=R0JUB3_ANAPL|nr:hypothetical protein Anapl_10960 [Anas platyrhynchos]
MVDGIKTTFKLRFSPSSTFSPPQHFPTGPMAGLKPVNDNRLSTHCSFCPGVGLAAPSWVPLGDEGTPEGYSCTTHQVEIRKAQKCRSIRSSHLCLRSCGGLALVFQKLLIEIYGRNQKCSKTPLKGVLSSNDEKSGMQTSACSYSCLQSLCHNANNFRQMRYYALQWSVAQIWKLLQFSDRTADLELALVLVDTSSVKLLLDCGVRGGSFVKPRLFPKLCGSRSPTTQLASEPYRSEVLREQQLENGLNSLLIKERCPFFGTIVLVTKGVMDQKFSGAGRADDTGLSDETLSF